MSARDVIVSWWNVDEEFTSEGALADSLISALAAAGFEIVRAHKWHFPAGIEYECCRDCGIVRRADDRNRPCIGPVRVGLRHHEPLKAEYTEGAVTTLPTPDPEKQAP